MSQVIISFPPGAGGNHLKNLLSLDKNNIDKIYSESRTVHSQPGSNFKIAQAYDEAGNIKECVLHGHFGEVMSHRDEIKTWPNPKFILISPDTYADRQLLHARWKKLGPAYQNFKLGNYYDGEQVFLYEPFIFRDCFATHMDNIMNISISEWFIEDISAVLDKISKFLQIDLNINECQRLHKLWCNKNLDIPQ